MACDLFTGMAKLRALRKLWAGIVATLGGSGSALAATIHARGSERVLTGIITWVNLLRATVECFSGAVGGADSVSVPSFDAAIGPSDSFARRMARNTQIILRDEAHVHRVIDPGGEATSWRTSPKRWRAGRGYGSRRLRRHPGWPRCYGRNGNRPRRRYRGQPKKGHRVAS